MTERIGQIVFVDIEPPAICVRCKKKTETRDVLGDGTRICFACATAAELDAYGRRLFGIDEN